MPARHRQIDYALGVINHIHKQYSIHGVNKMTFSSTQTMLQHSLETAAAIRALDSKNDPLIVAALLHNYGKVLMLASPPKSNIHHLELGAKHLARYGVIEPVLDIIKLQRDARRYLARYHDQKYGTRFSPYLAQVSWIEFGNVYHQTPVAEQMTIGEMAAFASRPQWREALKLRMVHDYNGQLVTDLCVPSSILEFRESLLKVIE